MPNYRRLLQPGGTFFFTLVTAERRNLFSDDVARRYLRTAISTVQATQPFDMVAIVLLPNHIHCIWTLPEDDATSPHAGLVSRGCSPSNGSLSIMGKQPSPPRAAGIGNAGFGKSGSGNTESAMRPT